MVVEAFVRMIYHVQLVWFTAKSAEDSKGSDNQSSDLRVLGDENTFTVDSDESLS